MPANRFEMSCFPRVNTATWSPSFTICNRQPSNLGSCSQPGPVGSFEASVGMHGGMKVGAMSFPNWDGDGLRRRYADPSPHTRAAEFIGAYARQTVGNVAGRKALRRGEPLPLNRCFSLCYPTDMRIKEARGQNRRCSNSVKTCVVAQIVPGAVSHKR